jgi:DNA invertase Pin-like site-specific DNA recombinase
MIPTNRFAESFTVRAYGRASTLKQVMSPLQQEAACQDAFSLYKRLKPDWANAEWGGFFFDEATTRTSKFRQRSVGSLVLASTKPGDVIMAANFDRIFANVSDVCETLELVELKRFRLAILDMDIDISGNLGQAVFKIMAAVKELDVKEIRRRGRETVAHRKANGLPHGKHPIGWRTKCFRAAQGGIARRYSPNADERELARLILSLRTERELSLGKIGKELTRRHIKNPRGTAWTKPAVSRWIKAALLDFPLRNGTHTPAPIPPDAEPVDHVNSILADD